MKNTFLLTLIINLFCFCVLSLFAQQKQPVTLNDIKNNLKNYKTEPDQNCNTLAKMNVCVINSIKLRGISFTLSPQDEMDVRKIGATDELIITIRKNIAEKKLYNFDYELDNFDKTFQESFLINAIALNDEALDQLVNSSPDSIGKTYFNRARIYYRQKKYDLAIPEIIKAINKNFKGVEVYEFLGSNYQEQGNYDKAIENYTIALNKYDKENTKALNNRGNSYSKNKEYDLAVKDYSKAIELDSEASDVYSNRGLTYSLKEEYELAFKDINKAIELNPSKSEFYVNRGLVYTQKKNMN